MVPHKKGNLEDSDSDDYGQKKNPKKLPVGWDGKPIPYWLYKLHGLGEEISCEICGGSSYWGRKAFDDHFNQWRHSYGLKCLNIKNSDDFKGVTSIHEAVLLCQRLKTE